VGRGLSARLVKNPAPCLSHPGFVLPPFGARHLNPQLFLANQTLILEMMAINVVLPLKAARRDAIATSKFLGLLSGHQRLNFDGSIYIRYAAPPRSTGTVLVASIYGRRVKTSALFFVILHSVVEMNRYKISSFSSTISGGEPLKLLTCICKYSSLPNMSQSLVEFCLLASVCETWQ